LQRPTGNQAVQQMLQTHAEEPDVGWTDAALRCFGHDFSRIPIHPPPAGAIPTKLAINKQGDEYEQEAERVSQLGFRTPEPQRASADSADHVAALPSVYEGLASPGQLIEPATRSFMQSRLGHDFSKVRVHTDATASQSADAVNALAYTVGQHIVFGKGQYAPASESGSGLLAHELVHVIQQTRTGPAIQRAPRKRPDITPDELSGEMRQLLDRTQERFNHYVTELRPHYRNASELGRKAAEYLQRDFVAVFGEGVDEAIYSLHGSEHRIDLFVSQYNVGIELKLSGAARAEQRRAFFYRAWGKKGEAHTLAYVGAEGWWAGAGDKLPPAKLKALRKDLGRLKTQALSKVEEAAGKAERAEAKAAGKAGKAERSAGKATKAERAESKAASKVGKGLLGKAVSKGVAALGVKDVVQDLMSGDVIGAAEDAVSVLAPELSLAADALGWGYHKIFGSDSEESEPVQKPTEPPPQHRPIPGAHYFIPMGDDREIEVDAVVLLNESSAKPIYPDEKFPGEANQEWQKNRKVRIHREVDE
jgi:hypothetical protein